MLTMNRPHDADDSSLATIETNDTNETSETDASAKKKKKVTDPLTLNEQNTINSLNKNITITDNGCIVLPDIFFEKLFMGEQPNYLMHWCRHTIAYYGYFKHVSYKLGPITAKHVTDWNNSSWSDEDHTKWRLFARNNFVTTFKVNAQRAFQEEAAKRALFLGLKREGDTQHPFDVNSILHVLASPSYKHHFCNDNMLQLFQWTHYIFRAPFLSTSNEWAYNVVRAFCHTWNIDITYLADLPNSGEKTTSRRHALVRMVSKATEHFGQQCRRWEHKTYGFSYRKCTPKENQKEAFFEIANPKGFIVIHNGNEARALVCNLIKTAVRAAQTQINMPEDGATGNQTVMSESVFLEVAQACFKGNCQYVYLFVLRVC